MSIQPKLRQFDLTMIVVSLVIGVGIFRNPQLVAEKSGNEFTFFAAWIFAGFISICGALTFAEIGARLPVAGGYYKIFSYAYHPAVAFMFNWSQMIINAGSSAGVAITGAEYMQPVLFPEAQDPGSIVKVIAVSIIVLLFAINYAGIKMGARTQNFLSIFKIVMITVFCFAIFGKHAPPETVQSVSAIQPGFITAFGGALIAIFFSYGGYQNTINLGADIQNGKSNIPKAIIKGMMIVIVLYLCLNFAYIKVLGFEGVKHSPLLASALAQAIFGNAGFTITSIVIFVSVLGFLNTALLSSPRVYYAMAEEKTLPPIFKKVNGRTQVQEFALTFFVSIMLLSVFVLGSFSNIVSYVIFIDSISLAFAAASIFVLRKRTVADYEGFKMKLYPLLPALFVITLLFVNYNTIITDGRSSLYGFLIFAGGLPLYYLLRKLIKTEVTAEPIDKLM